MMVSIIIPTLNEEAGIADTVEALKSLAGDKEIIVADGGSNDRTVEIACGLGVQVVKCERGRGSQIRTAAHQASGDVLWFVHADSRPDCEALKSIEGALRDHDAVGGNFALVFEGDH